MFQNLLDEIARREQEVQKVSTHSQEYQQAVKVRCDSPAGSAKQPGWKEVSRGWAWGAPQALPAVGTALWGNTTVLGIEYRKGFLTVEAETEGIYAKGKQYRESNAG